MEEPKPSGGLLRFFALCFVPLPGILFRTLPRFNIQFALALLMGCITIATILHCTDRSAEQKERLQPPGVIFLLYLAATVLVTFTIFFIGCLSSPMNLHP
ncbi:MAG: hypothetical protein QM796_22495 [Chthoniobacteraceae bacterium]